MGEGILLSQSRREFERRFRELVLTLASFQHNISPSSGASI